MKSIKALYTIAFISMVNTANAEGFDGAEKSASGVKDFLLGEIATSIAIIAIIIVGYFWMYKRQLESGTAFAIIGGIVLIFGSPQIVEWVKTMTG